MIRRPTSNANRGSAGKLPAETLRPVGNEQLTGAALIRDPALDAGPTPHIRYHFTELQDLWSPNRGHSNKSYIPSFLPRKTAFGMYLLQIFFTEFRNLLEPVSISHRHLAGRKEEKTLVRPSAHDFVEVLA